MGVGRFMFVIPFINLSRYPLFAVGAIPLLKELALRYNGFSLGGQVTALGNLDSGGDTHVLCTIVTNHKLVPLLTGGRGRTVVIAFGFTA
jgi:hypothetical protein